MQNLAKINLHNANPHKTYEMGLNQFSAMTNEEFELQYLSTRFPDQKDTLIEAESDSKLGDVDWQSQGAVTRVKLQGQCVWPYAPIAAIEGLHKINQGTLIAFSEQQLIDCAASFGQGCNDMLLDKGQKYIISHGVVSENDYPYNGSQRICKNTTAAYRISGFIDVKGCDSLANALMGRPISVAVDATNWSPYKSGIFSNCKASLNHGVLLTGMTSEYWRIKNSWGASWGESGYIRIARGNTCGICNIPQYPSK